MIVIQDHSAAICGWCGTPFFHIHEDGKIVCSNGHEIEEISSEAGQILAYNDLGEIIYGKRTSQDYKEYARQSA